VEMAQPFVDARGHRLDIELSGPALEVNGDLVRLSQVVGNLLNNAAKYTEPHGVISVSAFPSDEEAVLTVRDNGVGISPELLPHVFDPFVQSKEGPGNAQGGLGIGLTLVKTLVELHGGTVQAASEGVGTGSRFTIRLPRLPSEHVRHSPAPRPDDPGACRRIPARRVLVVDDNRDAADSLAALLRLQGHDVRVAYDGESSVSEATVHRPELILLDIGMPGIDGYETARRIRRIPGLDAARLVALTGWGQEEDRRRTAASGFDGHLVKPPEPEALAEVLARTVDQWQ
jgi:CheY-like chemotaxis protein